MITIFDKVNRSIKDLEILKNSLQDLNFFKEIANYLN